jgi:type VI secretion system protein VasJ
MALSPEELVKGVQAWLEPVSAEAPTGANARYDADYEKLLGEIAKLEAPSGGAVDWVQVEKLGGGILQKRSKDLLVAAYTGYAFFAAKRILDGLLNGMVLLAELLDKYWDGLFPDRTRTKARANALGWFLQRTTIALGSVKVSRANADTVEALLSTSQRLTELARTKFAGAGPAFGPLLEALERLKLQLPPEAPPAPVPVPAPSGAPSAGAAPPSAPTSVPSSATAAPPPPPASAGDVENYLRGVETGLVAAAHSLRRADAADPNAYRLLRTAAWLQVSQLPPLDSQSRTSIPPLAPAVRTQLDTLAANGKFLELVEEAESAFEQSPLSLDLCRYSARGLASLGATHDAAHKALLAEVAGFLRRVPGVSDLLANDGTPLADNQTRAWLNSEAGASMATGGGGGGGGVNDDTADALREAKSLFSSGKSSEGLALLQSKVQSADSGHARFRLRLELAKLCVAANQAGLARAVYAALAKECTVHDLDTWEPQLSVECLEGLLSFRPSGALSEEDNGYYQRLCRISPAAAMRIQT